MHNTPLSFFPAALPDETLSSRVSRYHRLSGNTSDRLTFDDLFESTPFILEHAVPQKIETLASKLGANAQTEMRKLLLANTLFPIFAPFLGIGNKSVRVDSITALQSISRLPRRIAGIATQPRLCPACIKDDIEKYGTAYWHRAHQIPGVTVCWQHMTKLLASCPYCHLPFYFPKKILKTPGEECRCKGNSIVTPASKPMLPKEFDYAVFAQKLLQANLYIHPAAKLEQLYKTALKDRGLVRDNGFTRKKMAQEAIENALSGDLLRLVDVAYAKRRTSNWLSLHVLGTGREPPLTRHLILGLFLFETAERFIEKLDSFELAPSEKQGRKPSTQREVLSGAKYRNKINQILDEYPNATLEDLWLRAYTSTEWLYNHDKKWLESVIATKPVQAEKQKDKTSVKDKPYSELISRFAIEFLNQSTKPRRLTKVVLYAALPKSIIGKPYKERYPLTFAMIERYHEHTWHLRLRRVIWCAQYHQNLGRHVSFRQFSKKASIKAEAITALLAHFDIDLQKLILNPATLISLVDKRKIPLSWKGP